MPPPPLRMLTPYYGYVTHSWKNVKTPGQSALSATLAILDEAAGCDPRRFVRELDAERPEDLAVLSTAVAGAYFLNPQVREMIGYPGQEASPLSLAAVPEYVENGMLERVYERHPGFRL